MKKTMTVMAIVSASLVSQIALAESRIICENDRVQYGALIQPQGLQKAVEKLNATLKGLGDQQVSRVSAPSIALDGNGYTVCVTITR